MAAGARAMRRLPGWRRLVFAALLVARLSTPAAAAEQQVVVLADLDNAAQAEAVGALRAELEHDATPFAVLPPDGASASALAAARLVVTVGGPAARAVATLATRPPVLHVLLSRATLGALAHRPAAGAWSALVLDQPAERQIALIRLALPDHDRIATIAGPDNPELADELARAARRSGLDARSAPAADISSLYAALREVLASPAVLVITPDAHVFNSQTVHHVLLTAFHLQSPVLGFSAAYVRAGAVLGLYTTPAQAGREAAGVVRRVLGGQALPPPAAHAEFEVGVNPTVARALGLQLPAEQALTAALRSEEGRTP